MVSPIRSLPRCVVLVLLLALIALPLVSGCASNKGLRPMEGTADEADTIAKEGKHLVAVRLLTPIFSQNTENLPTFSIAITNRGDEPLPFGPDAVSVYSGGESVQAFTPKMLTARMREDAARQAERLARRTRQDGEQTARYFAEQAEMSLPPDLQPHIRANYTEIAKMERALRATIPARHVPSVREDQWKEIAWILTPIRVPAGETVHRRLKLNPEHIRLGEPLRIEVEFGGEIHLFAFFAETRDPVQGRSVRRRAGTVSPGY